MPAKAFAVEHAALEVGGAGERGGVGGCRGHQRGIVAEGEALGEVLEVGDLGGALGLHVEHADVEALGSAEIAPHVAWKALGDEQAVGDLRGVVDEIAQHRRLALGELAIEVAVERLAVDASNRR